MSLDGHQAAEAHPDCSRALDALVTDMSGAFTDKWPKPAEYEEGVYSSGDLKASTTKKEQDFAMVLQQAKDAAECKPRTAAYQRSGGQICEMYNLYVS